MAVIGETYHEHRRELMRDLWLGLTDLYNLFHRPDLTAELITNERGDRSTITGEEGLARLLRLRELHIALDTAVLAAYGWDRPSDFGPPFQLRHGFQTLDNLPENDRIRFTLHPEARREVLARLLKLNHQRAAAEKDAASPTPLRLVKTPKKAKTKAETKPPRRHSKGINFKRGAIAAYAVNRLAGRQEFGRTQMEKVLYLAQQGLGVDLEMEFQREAAGPFDEEIHKLESLAAKQQWFTSTRRAGTYGTSYAASSKIAARCEAATAILGAAKSRFDWVLDQVAKMDTEKAELWATVHAAWNDLLLAGTPASDPRIVQEVHACHPSKGRFTAERITKCIAWIREQDFVPRGIQFKTREEPVPQDEFDF